MKTSNGVKKQKKPQSPEKSKPKDHRELGRELDLFSFHEVSPGAPLWHYQGMLIVKALEKCMRELQDKRGYEEISTPIMVKKELFEKSGHWEFFKDDMFYFKAGTETYALKPMNCPESALVYQTRTRSYRDLPLRLAEIGRLHRNELSGVLGGLLRVRQITMDDAHIYCRFDQIKDELVSVLKMTEEFYKRLGLEVVYGLATKPKKAMGDPKTWKEAEKILGLAMKELGIKFAILEGEGAFYGPKIHFDIKDSLGRVWTIATAQLDFQIPERFELEYIDADGKPQRPVIIHRAIFGSFERFVGILLEHFNGALPLWLSPVQVKILTLNDKVSKYAQAILKELRKADLRTEIDGRNETIGKKIREAEMQKIPYILVLGEKEEKSDSVNVRERGKEKQKTTKLDDFIKEISKEISA